MDMNPRYQLDGQQHCPNAAIVFDLFSVVAKYDHEAIHRVGVDRASELRGDQQGWPVIKVARWLLLRNRDWLGPGEDVQFVELLAADDDLFVVHVLRDALKDVWRYRHRGYAACAWRSWYRKVPLSGIQHLIRFAQLLKLYLPGILAHRRQRLGTSLVEGINKEIKVIKYLAYGCRDDSDLVQITGAAFPGNGR